MDQSNLALGLDRLGGPSPLDGAAAAHALGIQAITLLGLPKPHTPGQPALSFLWDELDPATQAATLTLRSQFDRAVIHAPFYDAPLVSPNPYIEREALRQVRQSIRAAGALGLEVVTVHAPLPIRGMALDEFRHRLAETLYVLGEKATQEGTRIGLENWRYPCDPGEHLHLLELIDHPAVGATLDVGHIAYWYQNEGVDCLADAAAVVDYHLRLKSFIDQLGRRIIHVHVHDVRAADLVDHRGVGRGCLDFAVIMAWLEQIEFDGVLLLELAEPDLSAAVSESVARLVQAIDAAPHKATHHPLVSGAANAAISLPERSYA
jgi:sugar phosphate isomerase/epimerase